MLSVYTMSGMGSAYTMAVLLLDLETDSPTNYLYTVNITACGTVVFFLCFMFLPKFYSICSHQHLEVGDLTRKIDADKKRQSTMSSAGHGSGHGVVRGSRVSHGAASSKTKRNSVEMGAVNVSFSQAHGSSCGVGAKSYESGSSFASASTTNPMASISENAQKQAGGVVEKELRERIKKLEKQLADEKKKGSMMLSRTSTVGGGRESSITHIPSGSKWQVYFDDNGFEYFYNEDSQECTYSKPARW